MTLSVTQSLYFEDVSIGMRESYAKEVKSSDVVGFAEISGDRNPIHLSEHFAAKIIELLGDPARLERMRLACRQWHFPGAAEEIAQCLLAAMDPGPMYLPAADPTGAVAPRPAGPESHISTHSGAVI